MQARISITCAVSAFLIFFNTIVLASDITDVHAGIQTRTACLESVRGLGAVSIIFTTPINKDFRRRSGVNEVFSWDAILVSETGKETQVVLHCTKVNQGAARTDGSNANMIFTAEIIKR